MYSFSGGEDNSDVAMGTVLSQREGDNLHVDLVTHSKVVFFYCLHWAVNLEHMRPCEQVEEQDPAAQESRWTNPDTQ